MPTIKIVELKKIEREYWGPLIDRPMSAWRLSILVVTVFIGLGPCVSDHDKKAVAIQFPKI